jgi:hypothetical protein
MEMKGSLKFALLILQKFDRFNKGINGRILIEFWPKFFPQLLKPIISKYFAEKSLEN